MKNTKLKIVLFAVLFMGLCSAQSAEESFPFSENQVLNFPVCFGCAWCGNGGCDGGENEGSCPDDCPAVCGNGIVAQSEACDDGDETDEDGCSNCSIDANWDCTRVLGEESNCVLAARTESATFTSEQERTYDFKGQVEDHAGNIGYVPNNEGDLTANAPTNKQTLPIKIDKTPPSFTGIELKNNGPDFRRLSSESTTFEANDTFDIKIIANDPRMLNGCEWDGSQCVSDGVCNSSSDCVECGGETDCSIDVGGDPIDGSASGINLERSWIEITGTADSLNLTRTYLKDLDALQAFSFPAAFYSSSTDEYPGFTDFYEDEDDVITITDDSSIFERAGDYTIKVVLRDRAENFVESDELEVKIVASEAYEDDVAEERDITEVSTGTNYSSPLPGGPVVSPPPGSTSVLLRANSCNPAPSSYIPPLANNEDVCEMTVAFRDRFGNPVIGRQVVAEFSEQDQSGTYDTIKGGTPNFGDGYAKQAFDNGLRFAEPVGTLSGVKDRIVFTTDGNGEFSFKIKAMVPTIGIIQAESDEDRNARDAYLMKVESRRAAISFLVKQVNDEGGELDTYVQIPESPETDPEFVLEVEFYPQVILKLSDKSGADASAKIFFNIGVSEKVYGAASTNQAEKRLPGSFYANLKMQVPLEANAVFLLTDDTGEPVSGGASEVEMYTISFTEDDLSPLADGTSDVSSAEDFTYFFIDVPWGEMPKDMPFAFSSTVEYEEDGKNIVYPGGNLGKKVGADDLFDAEEVADAIVYNESEVVATVIGADIEGQIITTEGKFLIQQSSEAMGKSGTMRVGDVSAADVREEITRNAYELIRGEAPKEQEAGVENLRFDVSVFEEGGVSYYKGESVEVVSSTGNVGSGRHTVIVEDGNLYIGQDFVYDEMLESSLGFILINSAVGPRPETGNIFIYNTVQRFVGTYFADGTITSTNNLFAWFRGNALPIALGYSFDRDNRTILADQLILEGTLFTRNTLGGSMKAKAERKDPWGGQRNEGIARTFDLHFIRRFTFAAAELGKGCCVGRNSSSCLLATRDCCDPNIHSFVVRPDGRVQALPPPGFEY